MQNPNVMAAERDHEETMARHMPKDLFSILSVMIYMVLVKVPTVTDIGFQHYKCKLLVVPDSHHAYTWIFHIRYAEKSPVAQIQQNNGWSYKAVIALVDDKVLESGPIPFWGLLGVSIWDAFHKSSSTNCPEMQPVKAWNESEITNFSLVNGRRKVLMWSSYSANGDRGCDQVMDNGQQVSRIYSVVLGEKLCRCVHILCIDLRYLKIIY